MIPPVLPPTALHTWTWPIPTSSLGTVERWVPPPQEVTHLDHKLEACTARFSGAGCPQRPGIGRKHQGPSSSHTTALLLPRDIVHTKDYMKDAFCTAPYLFLFCVFHRDTNPETILNRQEEAGSRQGEEKEKLSAYCGLRSPPTSAFTHSGGGGFVKASKVWLELMLLHDPLPLHRERSALFFWEMIVYLIGQIKFHSFVLSKSVVESKWTYSRDGYFCASSLTSPPMSPPSTGKNIYIHIYVYWYVCMLVSGVKHLTFIYNEKILYFNYELFYYIQED